MRNKDYYYYYYYYGMKCGITPKNNFKYSARDLLSDSLKNTRNNIDRG